MLPSSGDSSIEPCPGGRSRAPNANVIIWLTGSNNGAEHGTHPALRAPNCLNYKMFHGKA